MGESDQVALYFLVGEAEDGGDPRVYVGQTGDLRARLASHNRDRDFWERAPVVISRTNSLTQTHALFLEWHCIQADGRAVGTPTRMAPEATGPTRPRHSRRTA